MKTTVQMTIRDEEFYIGMALQSVADKAYGIYVLDTGSSDNTIAVVKEYQKKYPHIILEEKWFGGRYKWDSIWKGKNLEGYKEAEARDYTNKRTKEEFSDYDWTILLDGDEIVGENMFREIDKISGIGAHALGHATLCPLFTNMILDTNENFRNVVDEVNERSYLLFDPHFRAWSRDSTMVWGYINNHISPNLRSDNKKAITQENVHFHLHYSFGPKSIHGWLCQWAKGGIEFAKSVGIPALEWDVQKHYEDKFSDWFVNNKFTPKKEVLLATSKKCKMIKPLPSFVVEKWNEWGDWNYGREERVDK